MTIELKKFVVKEQMILAVQFDGTRKMADDFFESSREKIQVDVDQSGKVFLVVTEVSHGRMLVEKGDWIIETGGEYTIMDDENFRKRYEEISQPAAAV